jgi:hypothetical protein
MDDGFLAAALEFVSSHPWVLAIVPAAFIVLQLTVVKKRNERYRRNRDWWRTQKRIVRDAHDDLRRRVDGG